MYIVALAISFIVLVAVAMAYPFHHNLSFSDSEKQYATQDSVKKDSLIKQATDLVPGRPAFPSPVPEIDITQPLLHPKLPTEEMLARPPLPIGTTDPSLIMQFPTLLVEDPKKSQLRPDLPQPGKSPYGTPFGDSTVTVKLPHATKLCEKLGIDRPPMFRLRGDASIHGNHLAHPAIDPEGNVIPHVFITSWNKYTGEVTLRNDVTNWHGVIELGYYQECDYPEDWDDEWYTHKYYSYPISI